MFYSPLVAGTEAAAYDLHLSETKTAIMHISRGFDFLGYCQSRARKAKGRSSGRHRCDERRP